MFGLKSVQSDIHWYQPNSWPYELNPCWIINSQGEINAGHLQKSASAAKQERTLQLLFFNTIGCYRSIFRDGWHRNHPRIYRYYSFP